MSKQFYQVGGSLPANSKSYIKRDADDKLYNYLKEGKYCYVLNARQTGKSSLRVHTSKRLEEDGYSCVNIDLTAIGSEDITADEWYFSFLLYIVEELELDEDEFAEWWEDNSKLTVVNRFAKTFNKFILKMVDKQIVIFIDEVDSILGIKKDFSADDFFAVIRTFYNLRSEDERYNRVTFALFGVATPEDLMRDSTRTPFNIAHSVKITQFKLEESLSLVEGLDNQSVDSHKILEKIFEWTGGTPYLTQKILDYISQNPIESIDDIDNIVDILFIQENFKEINISNVLNRIMSNTQYNVKMLYMIDELIAKKPIQADDSRKQQIYLKLSGLVKEEEGKIFFSNKIYEQIFNKAWLDETIEKIDRPLTKDLQRWIGLKKSTSALLKGDVLDTVKKWADGREDLSSLENEYLRLSVQEEQENIIREEKGKGQSRLIKVLIGSLIFIILVGNGLMYFYFKSEEFESKFKNSGKNIDKILETIEAKAKINSNTSPHYKIPTTINSVISIDNKVLDNFNFNNKESIKNNSALAQLILYTKRDYFNKQFWLNTISIMSDEQKKRLFKILQYSAYMDEGKIYNDNENIKKAIEFFQKAIDVNPNKDEAYYALGVAYRYESDKAMLAYQKAIEINPKNDKAYYGIGKIYSDKEEYPKAIEFYKKSIQLNSGNNKAYDAIGKVYYIVKQYDKALVAYKRAVEINPKNERAYSYLGWIYYKNNEYDKAITFLKERIKIKPNNSQTYSMIGWCFYAKHQYDKAIKSYQKALELNPKNAIYLKNIGMVYRNKKEYRKSIDFMNKALEIDSGNDEIYNSLGITYQKMKKYDKSINMINKAIIINPKEGDYYNSLGFTYSKLKDKDKAIEAFQKSFDLDMELIEYYPDIFEEHIIGNLPFNKIWNQKYIKLYSNKKRNFIGYESLKILQDITLNKEVNIDEWERKYSKTKLYWDFDNLDEWVENIKDKKLKSKLLNALKIFKNHNIKIEKSSVSTDTTSENKFKRKFKQMNFKEKKIEIMRLLKDLVEHSHRARKLYKIVPNMEETPENIEELIINYSDIIDAIDKVDAEKKEEKRKKIEEMI